MAAYARKAFRVDVESVRIHLKPWGNVPVQKPNAESFPAEKIEGLLRVFKDPPEKIQTLYHPQPRSFGWPVSRVG